MDTEKASTDQGQVADPDQVASSNGPLRATSAVPSGDAAVDAGTPMTLDMDDQIRLAGWKLHFLTIAMCLSVFLSSLETTIVGTSLVSIVDNLKGYSQGSWIVTSYLVTYTGFLIIWAKLSDILGRKVCLSTAIVIFVVASGACGAAQTTTQLIIFRAFQGMGGSGTMSLSFVIIPEMVPATQYALYGSITSCTFAIAYLLGPLIGGVVNDNTTWRWIFLLNLPAGSVALVLLLIAMPTGFPHSTARNVSGQAISKALLSRIDSLGFMLLLSACAFLIVALEESGTRYAWSDPIPIAFLILSLLLWAAFFIWEKAVSREGRTQEPVFAWRFVQHREFLGVLIVDFLAGVPFYVTIIQIPQRFQIVNGTSTLEAGVRMLPFILLVPICTALASVSASKLKIPPFYQFAAGCALQTAGTALMSTVLVAVSSRTYAYEAILGVGLGLNIGSVMIITPNLIRGADQSVAMAAITQFRALGGVIGLATATNLLNNLVRARLAVVLSPPQLDALLETSRVLGTLPEALQAVVRAAYAEGYALQMKAMVAFGAAQVVGLALMWRRGLTVVA